MKSLRFWVVVLAIITAGVIFWQWKDVAALASGIFSTVWKFFTQIFETIWGFLVHVFTTIWGLLGYGLVLLVLALSLIIIGLAAKTSGSPLRRILRFLALLSVAAGIWGILGWFGRGGGIGSSIIGSKDAIGTLRVAGLLLLGVILFAPSACLNMLNGFCSAIADSPKVFKITASVVIAVGILFGLVFWQRDALGSLANNVLTWIWNVFGWGLVLVGMGILITVAYFSRRQISAFVEITRAHHINRWVGGIIILFAIWGFLAFFALGGDIGDFIIGDPLSVWSALRILGLIVLGIIFMKPGILRAVPGLSGIFRAKEPVSYPAPEAKLEQKPVGTESPARGFYPLFRRERAPVTGAPARRAPTQPLRQEPPVSTPQTTKPAMEAPKPSEEKVAEPVAQPSDLKQVAQEVWKKYGESAETVTEGGWKIPPVDILDKVAEVELSEADNLSRAQKIEEALGSYGVDAKVVQINVGPTVTQFGLEPGWDRRMKEVKEKDKDGNVVTKEEEISRTRVKVDRITALANDLALALAAPSIRIEAPVPGKSVVGIEVPNTIFGTVSLRSVIESSGFQRLKARSKLTIALGKGAGGEAVSGDLSKMPHLLIAGATGSGKTVCLNATICCLLLHNTPDDVRFIMIDPKRVELTQYSGIPHMAAPVIVDTEKALGTLRWLNQEMDKRYKKMAVASVRNIDAYNKDKTGRERMPYLVLIIDELADLMMAGFEEVEHILCRLAQLARATGIHLVVATQRPSVDVVTGLIKANFPTRISFAVTSQVDSRTILDTVGAEKLLGRGDMLYMPTDASKPKRLQGCFVSDPETERLVYFWGKQKAQETASLNVEEITSSEARKTSVPSDPLLEQARRLAEEHGTISTSYLQRQLRIGYNRAARIMEELEAEQNKQGSNLAANPNRDGGAEVPKN